ncbi:MAG: hypothetical protein CVV47_11910 [Spirochaetae bacterium HGW-Spirochaetae-3]|jgi:hypothetical protein|nr:MAG: hypothetical protein CVV47_11910 [Spirochaetae bacterium HGW-Spirochaetae-3]
MKRILTITLCLLASGGALFAQSRLDAVAPKDARTMAMGGAFVAMSEGYQSFYGNPATFAQKEKELTLLSMTPWAYVSPTTENIARFSEIASAMSSGDSTAMIDPLNDLIVDNGFGMGMSVGTGWIGKGLGLGLIGSGEVYVSGNNLLGATGTIDGQIAGVVGIGVPLHLGKLTINVGGDVRPYLRMTGDIDGSDLLGMMDGTSDLMATDVNVGFGLAVDLGARVDLGKMFSVGVAVRDISTRQTYTESTIGDVLTSGDLPTGNQVEYPVYPNVTIGASVSPIPESLKPVIDVTVIAEIQDPVKVIQDNLSVWNLFHVGAEAEMLGGLFALRAGLNKGWISMGAGLDLLAFEFNVAVFTEELGPRPGDDPRTGISAEVAIRF